MISKKAKKTIAIHMLGLILISGFWGILNAYLHESSAFETYAHWSADISSRTMIGLGQPYTDYEWDSDLDSDGGLLLLGMVVSYFAIFWAVKTIWFDKDQ